MGFVLKIILCFLPLLQYSTSLPPLKIDHRYVPSSIRQPKLHSSDCNLSKSTKAEIQSYQGIVNMLKSEVKGAPFQNLTYNDLSDFIYTIGPRITGSPAAIKAAEYFEQQMNKYGFNNVFKEQIKSPGITIGTESAQMIKPRLKMLSIIGSNSVNTGPNGIEAAVVVLRSLEDLETKAAEIPGRIVLFNFVFKRYKHYDSKGYLADTKAFSLADNVTKLGAQVILFRSATDFSLYTPHFQFIQTLSTDAPIPLATITIEDADLIDRLSDSGETVVVNFKRENFAFSTSKTAYNVIGDYPGSELPEEFLTLSGHLDNVPVGLGAQDDGIGVVLSTNAIRLLKYLNLKPRRTITSILSGSNELRHVSFQDSIKTYKEKVNDRKRHFTVLNADKACFGVRGFLASKPTAFACVLHEILMLFKSNYVVHKIGQYTPIANEFIKAGVPFGVLDGNRNERLFWYVHTRADTIDAVNPLDADECLAVYAATAYILADLKKIPYISDA